MNKKNIVNKITIIGLLLVFVLSFSITAIVNTKIGTSPTSANGSEPTATRMQSISFANKFIYFDLYSAKRLSDRNINSDIVVVDSREQTVRGLSVSALGEHTYRLNAPREGYIPGRNYTIRLGDGISFVEEAYSEEREVGFQIDKTEIEKLDYKSTVRYLEEPEAYRISEDSFCVLTEVNIGDILMVYDEVNEVKQQIAVKVKSINGQTITVEEPKLDEIFDELDVFKTYIPPADSILFDETHLEKEALEIPQIRALILGTGKIPKISVKIDEHWDPIKVTIEAYFTKDGDKHIGSDKNKAYIDFEFSIRLKAEINPTINVNLNASDFNVSIATESKIQLTAHFKEEVGVKLSTPDWNLKEKQEGFLLDPGYINYKGEHAPDRKDDWKEYTGKELANAGNSNADYKHKNQYNKKRIDALQETNAEKIKAINDLISLNSADSKERRAEINVCKIMLTLCPGLGVKLDVCLFFEASLKVELDLGVYIKINTECGVRNQGTEVKSYFNVTSGIGAYFELKGTLSIRAGIRGNLSVNLVGIFDVGVELDFGPYFEMQGSIKATWGPKKTLETEFGRDFDSDFALDIEKDVRWAYMMESGLQLKLSGKVKADFFLFALQYKFTIVDKKWDCFYQNEDDDSFIKDIEVGDPNQTENSGSEQVGHTLPEIIVSPDGYVQLPDFFMKRTNMETGEVTREKMPFNKLVFSISDYVYFKDGYAYIKDSNVQEFEEPVIVTYLKENDQVDTQGYSAFKIKKLPVKVESVALSYNGAGITSGGQDSVKVDIAPTNASYQNVEYYVEYVVRNGQRLTENLNVYARTDSTGTVSFLNTLSYGDKVGLSANAVVDNVESNLLELTVAKTSVREIRLTAEGLRSDVQPGGRLTLVPKINPRNATFQDVDLTIVSGAEFGTLSEDGRTLVCKENTPVNSEIRIVAAADGVTSREFVVRVGAIPVESVAVKEETTDAYLSKVTPIQLGSVIKLSAVASPENTTEHRSYFAVTKNPYAAAVSEDGELRITGDSAYVGKTVKVLASYGGVNSEEYEFLIEKVPVEELILTSYQNSTDVRPGGRLQLFTQVLPHNATFFSVNYTVIEGGEYAAVNEYGTLSVFSNAPVGGVIKIRSDAEGVYGNILTVNVVKIPVSEASISASGVKSVEAGGFLRLDYTILPLNASYRNIAFQIIEGEEYASVSPDGVLTVNGAVGIPDARIGVIAYVDGVYSNALYFDVVVPVRSVTVSLEGGVTEMRLGSFAQIQTQVNPLYATNTDVTYEITNNARYAKINAAYGYLSINYDAVVGEQVGFVAIVDGVRSEEYFVTIAKIPVTHIALNCAEEVEVGLGKAYRLSAQAAPLNATYSEITYVLLSGGDIAHIGSDGTLTISPNAQVGDKVTWKAVADGVESGIVTVTVVPVRVSYLEIFAENNELRPGGRAQITYKINEDATDKNVTYRIVEGAEYAEISADGVLSVQPAVMTGDAVVRVAATAGGMESNCLAFRIFVPVEYIFLTSESNTAAPGERFLVTPGVNPNATDQTVRVEIVRGAEYVSAVSGFLYAVVPDVTVSYAQIVLRAYAQGVESNELTIDIHVPVENVRLSASDFAPKQGDTVTLRGAVTPAYATDQAVRYSLVMPVEGVTLNETTGELQIAHSVPVDTQILVEAACDGVVSETLSLRVHKVPVGSVRIYANEVELMQGQSMAFSASVLPETATFKEVRYAITAGAGYGKIDGNLLTVHQNAPVGEKICVTATADGVTSAEYEITILKVPVAFVEIHTGGIDVANAGETVQFFGTVSENATYGMIVYRILDGGDYASITADGMLTVNRYVPVPNAVVRVVGRADGVDSNVYALSVYNPVTNITLSADQTVLRPGESFTLSAAVNANATDPSVEFGVVAGSEYITVLGNGSYAIRNDIRVANAVIRVRALKDGVVSNEIAISVYIDVTGVELANASFDIMQGESVTLKGKVTPAYATNASIVYVLKDPVNGVTLNTTTGVLTVSKAAAVGDEITVYAIADGVRSKDYRFTVCKIPVSDVEIMDGCSEVSVMQGNTLQFKVAVYPEDATYQNVTFAIDAPASVATITQTGLLTVRANVPVGTNIRVTVTADGKASGCTVVVAKVPVTGVTVRYDAADSGRVLRGDRIRLTAEALPANATYRSIVYSVVSGEDYAGVDASGVITVASDIRVRDAQFVVRASSADNPNAYADTAFTVYIPATGVTLTASDTRPTSTATAGSTVVFTALPVPAYASAQAASYELVSGGSYGTLSGNVLTVKSDIRVPDAKLTVRASIEGISKEVTASVVVPAASVSFQTPVLLASGTESAAALYRVKATVAPSYATNTGVTYSVSSRYASINALTGELTVYSEAPNNFSVVVTATASNGVSKAYTVNQTNATGLTLSRIARSSSNTAIEWDGARNTDGSVTYSANKALPGDVLRVEAAFSPDPSFKNYEVIGGYGYTVNADRKSITISPLSAFHSDIPSVTVTIRTTHNGTMLAAAKTIYIYLPVERVSMNLEEVKRGETTYLTDHITMNSGYATNKSFSLEGLLGGANGKEQGIEVAKAAPAGTEFTFSVVTEDGTFSTNAASKSDFKLRVAALTDEELGKLTFEFGNDSVNNVRVISQLENGSYVYVTPKFGTESVSLYGMEFTASKTGGCSDVEVKTDPNDGVDRVKLNVYKYVNNSTKNSEVSGRENSFTFQIELTDGTNADGTGKVVKTFTRTISIFNKINQNSIVKFTNSPITTKDTQLTVSGVDQYATATDADMSFEAVSGLNYSVTAGGVLTVRKDTPQTIEVKIYCNQRYNGKIVEQFSTKSKLTVQNTASANFDTGSLFESGGLGTSFTGWATLDVISDEYQKALCVPLLKELGYTKMTIGLDFHVNVWGTIEYQFRLYDVTAGEELCVKSVYTSPNGESSDKFYLFQDINISNIDSSHKIEVQLKYRKTIWIWGGDFTIQANRSYSVNFS